MKHTTLLAAITVTALALTACGGSEETESQAAPETTAPSAQNSGEAPSASQDDVHVDNSTDNFSQLQEQIKAQRAEATPIPDEDLVELTFEVDSSAPTGTVTYTDDKGPDVFQKQQMPFSTTVRAPRLVGSLNVSPDIEDENSNDATWTCRVLQDGKVIAETKDQTGVASCMWSGL